MMKSVLVVIVCTCFLASLVLRVSIGHKVRNDVQIVGAALLTLQCLIHVMSVFLTRLHHYPHNHRVILLYDIHRKEEEIKRLV